MFCLKFPYPPFQLNLFVGKFSFAKLFLIAAKDSMPETKKRFLHSSHLALSRVFNLPVEINFLLIKFRS